MGTIITYINEKGGIGKTSCCFNAGWKLSEEKKVLFIDLDGQQANLTFFCGIEKQDDMLTMYNVLQIGADVVDAIIPVKENLWIVPATVAVANLNQTSKITRMRKALESVKNDYDYIFIDVNPTPNWSHVLALSCSDYAIVPMLPDIASLEANKGITESIEEVWDTTNPGLKVLGILFNKYDGRTNLSKQVFSVSEKMALRLKSSVFSARIRQAVVLGENVYSHVGVTEYAPKSAAAQDVVDFVNEIESKVIANG